MDSRYFCTAVCQPLVQRTWNSFPLLTRHRMTLSTNRATRQSTQGLLGDWCLFWTITVDTAIFSCSSKTLSNAETATSGYRKAKCFQEYFRCSLRHCLLIWQSTTQHTPRDREKDRALSRPGGGNKAKGVHVNVSIKKCTW